MNTVRHVSGIIEHCMTCIRNHWTVYDTVISGITVYVMYQESLNSVWHSYIRNHSVWHVLGITEQCTYMYDTIISGIIEQCMACIRNHWRVYDIIISGIIEQCMACIGNHWTVYDMYQESLNSVWHNYIRNHWTVWRVSGITTQVHAFLKVSLPHLPFFPGWNFIPACNEKATLEYLRHQNWQMYSSVAQPSSY